MYLMQKRVTLSLNDKIYDDFQKFCEENDVIASKRIERLMLKELEDKKKGGKK